MLTPPGLHIHVRPPLESPAKGLSRVVLVHGAMDRGGSFGRVAQKLRDLEVVTYDRRGYARSMDAGQCEGFEDQVADLLTVLEGRPGVVAGHSFGGNVALAAAQAEPALVPAAVVFEPPAPWTPGWPALTRRSATGSTAEAVAESFMRRTVGDRVWEHLPRATQVQRRAEGVTLLNELEALGERRPYDPSRITAPVVVGWGTASPPHLSEAARQLACELPNAVRYEVRGAGHGVHLTHASDFAAMIRVAVGEGRTAATASAERVRAPLGREFDSPHRSPARREEHGCALPSPGHTD